MNALYEWYSLERAVLVLSVSVVLLGVAMLLHVRKTPRDAHGKNRR